MMRSYWRGLTKCMTPAKTKNGPKSLPMGPILWLEDGLSLGDGEAALVERPPHNHAAEVLEAQAGHGPEVIQRADAAGVDQLSTDRPGHLAKRFEVGSLHQAVHVYRRVDEAADAPLGESRHHFGRTQLGFLGPPLGRDLPRARV